MLKHPWSTTTHLGFYNQLIKQLLSFITIVQQVHVNNYVVVKDIVVPNGIMVLQLYSISKFQKCIFDVSLIIQN